MLFKTRILIFLPISTANIDTNSEGFSKEQTEMPHWAAIFNFAPMEL